MAFKTIVFLASALLVESICASCGCGGSGLGLGYGSYGSGLGLGLGGASSGGGFPVQSASPQAANGLSVLSENQIEGCLDVGGQLPFVGAVGLQGQLPTHGSAGVNYCCGNNKIGINNAGNSGHGLGHGWN